MEVQLDALSRSSERREAQSGYFVDQAQGLYAIFSLEPDDTTLEKLRSLLPELFAQDEATLARNARALCSALHESQGYGEASMTAAVLLEGRALIAHIGETRAYLVQQGSHRQLTVDHRLITPLIERGEVRPDQIDEHPHGRTLSRTLRDKNAQLDVLRAPLGPGDTLALTTSGLTEDAEALRATLQGCPPERVGARLRALASKVDEQSSFLTLHIPRAPSP